MQNQALNNLLRQWLRGEVRRAEESRLERSAQEDPFLSDAWEGYSQNPQKEQVSRINDLNAKIAQRAQGDKKSGGVIMVWFPRMAAAAAVLLLVVFGWRWLIDSGSKENLAIQVPKIESKNSPVLDSTEPAPSVADVQIERTESPLPLNKNKQIQSPANRNDNDPVDAPKKDAASEFNVSEEADVVQPEVAEISKTKEHAPGNTASTRAIPDLARTEAEKPANLPISRDLQIQTVPTVGGIVLDDQGQRAGGIPVQKNANTFAITNQEGAFELPAAAPAQVKVMANDFELQSIRLDDSNEKVVLQRKTKAVKKSFDASDRRDGVGYPSPLGGFEKFEQYIRENLETPAEAKFNGIRGDVTIEFTFEKDGTPTNLSVLRSLGFGCDQAAEHLIENGPKWRNVKPGVWVIYKVVFK
jgi:TonB family protein